MADQIRKWKDEASQLLSKGRYEKALALFQKVREQNPEDDACQNKIAYILQRLGRKDEAVCVLEEITNFYIKRGFLLKAVATCKMILEIDSGHKKIQQKLAELYASKEDNTARPAVSCSDQNIPVLESSSSGMLDLSETDPVEIETSGGGIMVMDVTTPLTEIHSTPPLAILEQQAPEVMELQGNAVEVAAPAPAPESVELPEIDIDFEPAGMEAPSQEHSLPNIPLLSDLPQSAFVALLENMKLHRIKAGGFVIREGEEGHSLFVVARGTVRVLKKLEGKQHLQLAALGEGAFFGEMAVLRGGPRGASVQATSDCELLEITKELLEKIVTQFPGVEEILKKFAAQRLLRNVMAASPLLRPFVKPERIRIIERFLSRNTNPGEELVTEGRESDGLYLVLRGRMDVFLMAPDGSQLLVGHLAEGEVFGEISCLYQEPAMATVRVATPGAVLRLPRQSFGELILSHPQVLELVHQFGEQHRALTKNTLEKKGIYI